MAPNYANTVVHVNDASRAVTVVGNLLKKDNTVYKNQIRKEYDKFREKFLNRSKTKEYISIDEARKRKFKIDWQKSKITKPNRLGIQEIQDFDITKLETFIDWSPFFRSWDLHGKYPDILTDKVVGEQATELFADAQELLKKVFDGKLLKAKAVFGLFPANTINDDDIEVSVDKCPLERSREVLQLKQEKGLDGVNIERSRNARHDKIKFLTLRQQLKKRDGISSFSLADFIAPKETNIQDYVGAFCVSTGFGTKKLAEQFEAANDDYNSIMIKALADRLAEAFAEYLHKEVRTKHWGYSSGEILSNEDLIKESYKGIRPAPGYPACPDHLEKKTIWNLLDVESRIGVELTESLAMWPAASVSGYYFGNEEAKYFGLGKITEDQLVDYSKRREISIEEAKKWLNSNLAET
ncbi:MAG: hypothetical protein COA67_09200 [Lutibacter sp.]|nr:MAG: hypothetical protein COA67_09200 [Lutibacter sp.]